MEKLIVIAEKDVKKTVKGDKFLDLSIKLLDENLREETDSNIRHFKAKIWNVSDDSLIEVGKIYKANLEEESYKETKYFNITNIEEEVLEKSEIFSKKKEEGVSMLRNYIKDKKSCFKDKELYNLSGNLLKKYLDRLSISGVSHRNYIHGAIEYLEIITENSLKVSENYRLCKGYVVYFSILNVLHEILLREESNLGFIKEKTQESVLFNDLNFSFMEELSSMIEECFSDESDVKKMRLMTYHFLSTKDIHNFRSIEMQTVKNVSFLDKLINTQEEYLF